jgi:hypothetical protein
MIFHGKVLPFFVFCSPIIFHLPAPRPRPPRPKRLGSRWGPDSPPSEQREGGLENIHEWFILVHNG